ncbi:MAG: glycosyltransferase [Gammaproteobacteria bacterium]|nr:glycosyltransferase [Gammaproteobacteria bacterium]
MRVLMTPVGSAGDNLPLIGIGRELARRGCDVTVATSDHFADVVRRCGARFVSTATEEEYRLATDDPSLFHPIKGYAAVMERVVEYNRRLHDIVDEHARQGPLTVVAHSLDFASRVLADAAQDAERLRVVRVHLQPSILRSDYRVPVLRGSVDYSFLPRWLKRGIWSVVDRAVLDPPLAPAVNAMRARAGLAPARRIFVSQLHSPLLTLAMFPDWYAPPQPDWPANLEQCGFPLFDAADRREPDAVVQRFLDAGPAPIVFTPGSAMRFAHEFFDAAVGACTRLGRRGLLLTPHAEQVPDALPSDIARFDYVPLGALLRRCSALVHHGGIGTAAAGLAAGVPQVVVPFSHDQPDNAARVLRLGVGRRIVSRRFTAVTLARVLEELLGAEEVARRCAAVAARCAAEDGIACACDSIEAVMRGGGLDAHGS